MPANRTDRARKPGWLVWMWGSTILLVQSGLLLTTGCDRTEELAGKDRAPSRVGKLVSANANSVDRNAQAWLEKCADAYARVTSYEDSARVVMSYKVDGQPTQDVAPLSVAFESPNRLGLKAYQVLAGPTQNRWRLRVETKSDESQLSRQVISRELPKQTSLSWLMTDPVAVEHWAAGLAGSPPQLELLLGEQPFRALLDGADAVALDGQGTDGGQTYQIVKVLRGESRYRLWISAANSLLRRIELPTASLPVGMLSDSHITDIRLSIELDDPRIGTRLDWSKWEVPVSPTHQLVRYFVPPPPAVLDPRLGKAVPAFRLPSCVPNEMNVDTSAAAGMGQVQVLLWLADHPTCRVALEQLNAALARVPEPLRERISPVVVWAEADPPTGMTFGTLKKQWQMEMPLVRDSGEVGRDVLGIAEAPAMIVLDSKHRLQLFQQRGNPMLADMLPDMLMRLVKGENLGLIAQNQVQLQHDRYIASLWQARASDCVAGAFTRPSITPPGLLQLEPIDKLSIKESLAALHADAQHNLWTLRGDGQLVQFNPAGKAEREIPSGIDWMNASTTATGNVRMTVDDAARFLAVCSAARDRLHLVDLSSRSSAAVELNQQKLGDIRWLNTPVGLRLAAVTQSGKTLLIDPARFQQHSGQSDSLPLAILPRIAEEAVTSGYVILSDGRIEPLIVQDEGGAKAAANGTARLGQPTSVAVPGKDLSKDTAADRNSGSKVAGLPLANGVLKQLQFTPAPGPWCQWRDPKHTLTLAAGRLASDEPAVFILDDKLQQLWHAPLPIQDGAEICGASVATDPSSGQAMWVIATRDSTVHFFRADGQLVDSWQSGSPLHGVALVPMGQELRLWVAQDNQLIQFRIAAR